MIARGLLFGKNDRCTKALRDKQWISSRDDKITVCFIVIIFL